MFFRIILRRLFRRRQSFAEAFDDAQRRDLAYHAAHPGCSYEDAHRERDAVLRKYHLY